MVYLALCAVEEGLLEEAKGRLETVLEYDPHYAFALVEYAKIMQQEHVIPLAQKCSEQAVESAPENAEVWRELGNVFHIQNQIQRAIESYEKSLQLDEEQPELLLQLKGLASI